MSQSQQSSLSSNTSTSSNESTSQNLRPAILNYLSKQQHIQQSAASQTNQGQAGILPATNLNGKTNNSTLNPRVQLNKSEVVISIENFQFCPRSLYVHTGTRVRWVVKSNKATNYSAVYEKSGPRFFVVSIPEIDEESDPIHENEEYEVILNKTGKFEVVCSNYLRMKAELFVLDPSISSNDLAKILSTDDQQALMAHVDGFKYSSQSTSTVPQTGKETPPLSTLTYEIPSNPIRSSTQTTPSKRTPSTGFDSTKKGTLHEEQINGSSRKQQSAVVSAALEEDNEEDRKLTNDFMLQLKEQLESEKVNKTKKANGGNAHYLPLYKDDYKEDEDEDLNKPVSVIPMMSKSSNCIRAGLHLPEVKHAMKQPELQRITKKQEELIVQQQYEQFKESQQEEQSQMTLAPLTTSAASEAAKPKRKRVVRSSSSSSSSGSRSRRQQNHLIPFSTHAYGYESDFYSSKKQKPHHKMPPTSASSQIPTQSYAIPVYQSPAVAMTTPLTNLTSNHSTTTNSTHFTTNSTSTTTITQSNNHNNTTSSASSMAYTQSSFTTTSVTIPRKIHYKFMRRPHNASGFNVNGSSDTSDEENDLDDDSTIGLNNEENDYDCNAVISEEDTSAQTSKENSVHASVGSHSRRRMPRRNSMEQQQPSSAAISNNNSSTCPTKSESTKGLTIIPQQMQTNILKKPKHKSTKRTRKGFNYPGSSMTTQASHNHITSKPGQHQSATNTTITTTIPSTNPVNLQVGSMTQSLNSAASMNVPVTASNATSANQKKLIGQYYESSSSKKSPAQSILTTAESSKYSDTTKQFSQKGDFESEAADMQDKNSVLSYRLLRHLQHKRRASTDQTISESRSHGGHDDSDTRSIKSLQSQPISHSSGGTNSTPVTTAPAGCASNCTSSAAAVAATAAATLAMNSTIQSTASPQIGSTPTTTTNKQTRRNERTIRAFHADREDLGESDEDMEQEQDLSLCLQDYDRYTAAPCTATATTPIAGSRMHSATSSSNGLSKFFHFQQRAMTITNSQFNVVEIDTTQIVQFSNTVNGILQMRYDVECWLGEGGDCNPDFDDGLLDY